MTFHPHHTAISVKNLGASLKFYENFGFTEVHRYEDVDKIGVKMKLDGYVLEIFAYQQNQNATALAMELGNNLNQIGVKHIGFTVADLDEALQELKEGGLANETTEILTKGSARLFFVKDPDGVWVEVIKDDRY